MKNYFVLILISLASVAVAQTHDERLLRASGYEKIDQVAAIRFTFNVKVGERSVARVWEWDRTTGMVTFRGPLPGIADTTVTYKHGVPDQKDTSLAGIIDRRFINDQYWLLFPWHAATDGNVTVADSGVRPYPAPPGAGRLLVVQYGSGGGYTPGDRYDLYLDSVWHIAQWEYHHGGTAEGSPVVWDPPVQVGPIKITLNHSAPSGAFRLWFSDVAVKMRGAGEWISAQR